MHTSYVVTLKTKNSQGFSRNQSTLDISTNLLPPVQYLRKTLVRKNVYGLTWQLPFINSPAGTLTIYWCEVQSDTTNICDGKFDYIKIPANITNYELQFHGKLINFAVSWDLGSKTSGMKWSECPLNPDDSMYYKIQMQMNEINIEAHIFLIDLGIINSLTITPQGLNHESALIKWDLLCGDQLKIQQFNLLVCELNNDSSEQCTDGKSYTRFSNPSNNEYLVKNLLNDTTIYKIELSVSTINRNGPRKVLYYRNYAVSNYKTILSISATFIVVFFIVLYYKNQPSKYNLFDAIPTAISAI